jgi:CDP-4-dehydro-6-deoxyglucose reductase
MPPIVCDGRELEAEAGENVLDTLLRAGVPIASACRAGACQSCLVQVTRGDVPKGAQPGLKDSLRARGFALACQLPATNDLELSSTGAQALSLPARVEAVERLAREILRVRLLPERTLSYRAGQFLTLIRGDGLARSYSLASRPQDGDALELHVRVLPEGRMSRWLASSDALGQAVQVRGPAGDCFYTARDRTQPLVLVGVGSGLAPLWGIVRDALEAGHTAPIELWHGARTPDGLYLRNELKALSAARRNFSYHPCALEGEADGLEVRVGRLDELLLKALPSFAERRFFLCGDAPLVKSLKRALFVRGASLEEIYADPFVGADAA